VLVELRLYDLIESAVDSGKAITHFCAEAAYFILHRADLLVHVRADVLASSLMRRASFSNSASFFDMRTSIA
jgi:hypothetical protein